MSVSIHAVGFRGKDEKWDQMKSIWETCQNAGVSIPDEVEDFFGGENPGDKPGLEIDIDEASQEWSDDHREGFEIDISKLPKGLKFIRFYMSC